MVQAQAEVATVAAGLRAEYFEVMEGWGGYLQPLADNVIPSTLRHALTLLFAAVGVLQLIACANVANLLPARSMVREHELALRTAFGATRGQLIRQLLAEAAVLSVTGACLGGLLTLYSIDVLRAVAPADIPRIDQAALDGRSILFTGLIAVLTTLGAGLLPEWRFSRASTFPTLGSAAKTAGPSRGKQRLRNGLVVVQLALSLLLIAGADLLLRSFEKLQDVDPGYETGGILTFKITPDAKLYGGEARLPLYRQMKQRLSALPGVTGVGLFSGLPFGGGRASLNLFARDSAALPADESVQASWRIVDADYFNVLKIPMRSGRGFEDRDHNWDAPVIILSQSLAELFWPHEDAVGKRVVPGSGDHAYTVVDVVGDTRLTDLTGSRERPQMYFPLTL
ncbi:MAG: ABC transporter permease [Candidatus Synoicihabitans palmerolidicus]|nr:ABC transporter permease [Candidatus Synoicihabitans palmerolidicus]